MPALAGAASGAGTALGTVGAALALAGPAPLRAPALALAAAGLLALAVAALAARRAPAGRVEAAGRSGDRRRVVALVLQALVLATLGTALVALVAGLAREPARAAGSPALATVLVLTLAPALGAAHLQALRLPLGLRPGPAGRSAGLAAVAAAAALLALLAWAAAGLDLARLGLPAAPTLLLGGYAFVGGALLASRAIPDIVTLLMDERRAVPALGVAPAVVLAVLVAFASLFLVASLLTVGGVALLPALRRVPAAVVLVATLVLVAWSCLAGYVAFQRLAGRHPEGLPLYRRPSDAARRAGWALLAASGLAAAAIVGTALALHLGQPVLGLPRSRAVDLAALGLLAATGPPGLWASLQHRRTKRLEARLPDLFRDLAAGRKAGLTLPKAVATAAEGDYGALTPEVRRMATQLEWNVPFSDALQLFAERVRSPMAQRTASLLQQATLLGGHVSDVLQAVGRDLREARVLEDQRRMTMGLYVAIVHLSFLVFLGTIAILYSTLLPSLTSASHAAAARGAGAILGATAGLEAYRTFYLTAALVQAVGNGLVAGLIGTGRWSLGLRHAFVMVLAALVTFGLVLPRP